MRSLLEYDRALFRQINAVWHNAFLDSFMPLLRNQNTWIPLYIILLFFVVFKYRQTRWWWVLFAVITVALTDFISSTVIKHNIIRLRPCNDPLNASWIRLFQGIYLPKSSSFTSSHAANHFAMAMFFYATFKKHFQQWPLLFFAWAGLISYAQVYIGVHYPLDVFCGGLVGLLVGSLTGYYFNKLNGGLR